MNEQQFQELNETMKAIRKLLAMNVVKDVEPERQLEFLSNCGLHPSQIAEIIGKTENAVKIALCRLKKKSK